MVGHLHFWIATIPWTCPVCPAEMSRLSRGHSVQSMWNHAENRVGTFQMSRGLAPKQSRDTSERCRRPNSFMCSSFIGLLFFLNLLPCKRVRNKALLACENGRFVGNHYPLRKRTCIRENCLKKGLSLGGKIFSSRDNVPLEMASPFLEMACFPMKWRNFRLSPARDNLPQASFASKDVMNISFTSPSSKAL